MPKCPICKKDQYIKVKGYDKGGAIVYVCNRISEHTDNEKVYFTCIEGCEKKDNTFIIDIIGIRYIKCPECDKKEFVAIYNNDNECKKYMCTNKKEHKSKKDYLFSSLPIQSITLERLLKNIDKLDNYKRIERKYYALYLSSTRIHIDDNDIKYLELLLQYKVSRILITLLFHIDERTLRRKMKEEENVTCGGRFKMNNFLDDTYKATVCNTRVNYTNIFESKLDCIFTDYNDPYFPLHNSYMTKIKDFSYLVTRKTRKSLLT